MASNINPYNIDGTFPVAGQDNSSQGFRDNFTNIKNNFQFAQNELNDLQSKAIVTQALNGQTINNDMAGAQLIRPQLSAWTQTLLDSGNINGTVSLDFNQANFQKITSSGPITIELLNWPISVGTGALGYGVMRIWIVITDISHTVQLPAGVDIGDDDIAGYAGNGLLTFDAPGDYIFDISSIDGGNNFLIADISRNRATFRDSGFYYNNSVNSTVLIGYGPDALPLALALEQGEDKISVRGSYNSVSASSNYTGNVTYTQGDNGPTAGYSITGFRGNLDTGTIAPVKSGDFIGYVNTLSMTGTGSGNSIQSLSSMAFYATGANVQTGLGGNIALFTAPDQTGSLGFSRIKQAVGIENDQSTHFYGNIFTSNVYVPTSANSGGSTGQITFDASHIYVCAGPNNWLRANLSAGW